jgi:hypothetical protein
MQQRAPVFSGNVGVAVDKQTAKFEATPTRSEMQRSGAADDHKTNEGAQNDYDAKQKQ